MPRQFCTPPKCEFATKKGRGKCRKPDVDTVLKRHYPQKTDEERAKMRETADVCELIKSEGKHFNRRRPTKEMLDWLFEIPNVPGEMGLRWGLLQKRIDRDFPMGMDDSAAVDWVMLHADRLYDAINDIMFDGLFDDLLPSRPVIIDYDEFRYWAKTRNLELPRFWDAGSTYSPFATRGTALEELGTNIIIMNLAMAGFTIPASVRCSGANTAITMRFS
eukprot:jgi/Mesvir1/10365/Mv10565-RA.1